MKKAWLPAFALWAALLLAGCGGKTDRPSMYIEPAQLTEEEEKIAQLLGLNTGHYIFDFFLDESIRSIQVNTYELLDGEWRMAAGGGGQAFADTEGRIALGFDRVAEGVRIAVQSESSGGAVSYTPAPDDGFDGMGCATSFLSGPTEIVYERELPLAIQIMTAKNEIRSYGVESFDTPEDYAGYEHVYAVTVRFSQKTVSELSSDSQALP